MIVLQEESSRPLYVLGWNSCKAACKVGIGPAPHGLFFLPTHDLSGSDQVDEGLEMIVPDIFFAFPIQHSKPQLSHRNNQPQVKQYHYRRFSYNGGTTGYMMMGQWP